MSALTLEKPRTVRAAERALWAWTAWTCLFGLYRSRKEIAQAQAIIASQLQGMVAITAGTMMALCVAGYAIVALTMALVIMKIAAGKKWARLTLLASFVLDALFTLSPPYHGILAYRAAVPDLGLQTYALYLLYTAPGRHWFRGEKPSPFYRPAG